MASARFAIENSAFRQNGYYGGLNGLLVYRFVGWRVFGVGYEPHASMRQQDRVLSS